MENVGFVPGPSPRDAMRGPRSTPACLERAAAEFSRNFAKAPSWPRSRWTYPLTTGTSLVTAADGNFCSPEATPGAFGEPTTQAIEQVGLPSGDLTDGLPHASILVSNCCTRRPGTAVHAPANLPGPGSLS